MAIPAAPRNFYAQTADAKVYLSWSIATGATSYTIQRSTDGVSYSTLDTSAVNNYLDESGTVGTLYYYKVASVNSDGTSAYTTPQQVIPCPPGEVSLAQIRTLAQQRADLVNSPFVTMPEWNEFIRLACYELYDILIAADEDYYIASPLQFTTVNGTTSYALPNGTNYDGAPALYKLKGVDLGTGSAANPNGWVTMKKFNFIDRNKYFWPNTASTIYGVYNLAYRMVGSNLELIPAPSGGQPIQLWYVPKLPQLLEDTDTTTISISGWIQYVIIRAAKYALDKEESDTSKLDQELLFLKTRIEGMSQNRDAGQPDSISDIRGQTWSSGGFGPISGFPAGF